MNDNLNEGIKQEVKQGNNTPLIYGIILAAGFFLGANFSFKAPNKVDQILTVLDKHYVDPIDKDEVMDEMIKGVFNQLDPHSIYLSAEEYALQEEDLRGNFEGIGIYFFIYRDTLRVIQTIEGGPSEKAGILAGDCIIGVNDSNIVGINNNASVPLLLKGPKGSDISLNIFRRDSEELKSFQIKRATIPVSSISSSFMIEETIGMIKVDKFGENTSIDFKKNLKKLKGRGMKKLIIDLRNNGGGYLNAATEMLDEILPKGTLLVYIEGENSPRKDYIANNTGEIEDIPVVVLINESSASASEIFAGAMQDNDRGIILGRRSFGKGLVQESRKLKDKSGFRLTIARYYTPTGRSIQKPYGDGIDYMEDNYISRYESGELFNRDSIETYDSLRYITPGKKVVYGGGGIIPEVFIPLDTTGINLHYRTMNYSGVFRTFAFDYVNNNRKKLGEYASVDDYFYNFEVTDDIINNLKNFGMKEYEIEGNNQDWEYSDVKIKERIKSEISRDLFGYNAYYRVNLPRDNDVKKALNALR